MKLFLLFVLLLVKNSSESEGKLFISILKDLAGLGKREFWARGRMPFFGHECSWSRKPEFKKYNIRFKATVTCTGLPYSGRGLHGNPEEAINKATINFVKKATVNGLITERQAKPWIDADKEVMGNQWKKP